MKAEEDGVLLQKAAHGDVEALSALFERYKESVFRYALTIVRDYQAAEDVVQEVFLNVFRFASGFSGKSSVKTWIFAISKNAALKYLKKNAADKPYMEWDLLPEQEAAVQTDDFYSIIALLDPVSRDVVAMHLAGGLKHREIAVILGKTESAVKKQYRRALKWLETNVMGKE